MGGPVKTPKTVTIQIDTREQYPLLFPPTVLWHRDRGGKPSLIRVKKEEVTLAAGDYTLKGYDDVGGVERKGALDEIAKNFMSADYRRSSAAFQKLVETYEFPYLLLDVTVGELLTPTERTPEPRQVLDALLDLTHERGIRLLLAGHAKAVGARRILGEFVLRILLSHALREEAGPIDIMEIINGNQKPTDN